MADLLDAILRLWQAPPANDAEAAAAFGELYCSPVRINGVELTMPDLVARARALHRAFDRLGHELLQRMDTPDMLAVVFPMRGTHTGPLQTPLGEVAPTGHQVAIRTIDVLTMTEGRVSEVWVVADELGLLTGLGALAMNGTRAPPAPER